MKNELKTYRVTFYRDKWCQVEIAIVDVRSFSIGLTYAPAVRYLEANLPQTAAIVNAECVAFKAEVVPE